MNLTKALTIVFLLIAIFLAGFLVNRIKFSLDEEKRIARMEGAIIDQLIMIREGQIAYQAVHGQYTSDWDKLLNFIDSGSLYIVDKREIVVPLDYGADSVYIEIDTLDTVPVIDSIFNKYPKFVLAELPYVPGYKDKVKFEMWADKLQKSNVMVDVVEVWNPKPVNPSRKEDSEYNTRKPLRFGSRTSVTTAGNWE